ncbi:MAG TPA: hypothetical protein VMU07_02220 [Candidatus Paceibacterota bacterium]|nr:hypothetical protein [Candidatus Paceibacterota bacterium]
MRAFFQKHQFLVIWICGLLIVGALAVLVVNLNSSFQPTPVGINQRVETPYVPPPPPPPSVSLYLTKNGKNNSLVVQWANLPNNTLELNIFRGIGSNTSTYKLWETLLINLNLLNGSAIFSLGVNDLKYQYYVQALGTAETSGTSGAPGNETSTIVWDSTTPITPSTSTPPTDNGGNQNNGTNPTSTATSTNQNNNNASSTQNTTTTPTSTATTTTDATHAGNPFYNPQVQITGYGQANGSFWVQHSNQNIEIGWQNLASDTTDIIFYRAQNNDGPYDQFLEQANPGSTGSYSLQLVDAYTDQPLYYEMIAWQGSSASETYGPVYVPANGQ